MSCAQRADWKPAHFVQTSVRHEGHEGQNSEFVVNAANLTISVLDDRTIAVASKLRIRVCSPTRPGASHSVPGHDFRLC